MSKSLCGFANKPAITTKWHTHARVCTVESKQASKQGWRERKEREEQ